MLLRLPPELVTLILEHLWTEQDWMRKGRKGEGDLSRCCRVSKALCALAQPVLLQHVDISDPVIKPELVTHTRTLSLRASEDHLLFVAPMAPHLSSVARVTLELCAAQAPGSPVPRVDLRALQCISGLHALRVFDRVLLGSAPLRLDNLVVLELTNVTFEPASLLANLSPQHLPSLRALFLMVAPNNLVVNPALLSQLDCIQTDCEGWCAVPDGSRTPALLTVFEVTAVFKLNAIQASQVRHLRFMGRMSNDHDTRYLPDVIRKFANLQSVWLRDESHRRARRRARRDWSMDEWDVDFARPWAIDHDFWEYAKGLKAKGEV
ncbi:hypothetical protein JCM10450v2_002738 [Rhodotorula kratochvilovae]